MAGPNYQVTNIRVRQSPRLDANGTAYSATIVTFMVGPHGPFQLVFGPGQGTQQAITAGITATVNQLISTANSIAQLNAQTQSSVPQS